MNQKLKDFVTFCEANQDKSFWQCARDFADVDVLYFGHYSNRKGSPHHAVIDSIKIYLDDAVTFYEPPQKEGTPRGIGQ